MSSTDPKPRPGASQDAHREPEFVVAARWHAPVPAAHDHDEPTILNQL